MNNFMLVLFATTFIILLYNVRERISDYIKSKRQNNNYQAVINRNKAIIYGFLCIIFVIAFACNREEFISNNQFNNCPMDEQMNATTPGNQVCPWAVIEHGSTVARVNSTNLAGILPITFLLLFKKQAVRVKAVRFQFERDMHKTFVTRTYTIKSMPTIEQYLS